MKTTEITVHTGYGRGDPAVWPDYPGPPWINQVRIGCEAAHREAISG
jgi:hypothetical protein